MKSRIMPRCSIIANQFAAILVSIVLFSFSSSIAAECENGKGIVSNYMYSITGSVDALWILSWDNAKNQYAVNSIIHNGDMNRLNDDRYWASYSLGCINADILDLAYGGNKAVICFDTLKGRNYNPILILDYDGNLIREKRLNFNWSSQIKSDSTVLTAVSAIWSGDAFYFACLDGGLVRWNYQTDTKTVFLPGKLFSSPIEQYTGSGSKTDTLQRVEILKKNGNKILVMTPAKVWQFDPADSSWDSSISSVMSDANITFKRFEDVYASQNNTLYGRIKVLKNHRDTISVLAKYSSTNGNWQCMLDKSVDDVEFGSGDHIFTLAENTVSAYRDTLPDFTVTKTPVINSGKFKNWITDNFSIGDPVLNSIRYIAVSDSNGFLMISSNDGFFLSNWKFPVPSQVDFVQIKRAPQVKAGLKQTYARPGILVPNMDGTNKDSRTVFIYNLSKNGKVTIRVYDYNMDLVRTIINNKFRRSGNDGGHHGRSTVEGEDFWDGRNASGKTVAPGVYYYKITTDIGERAFGKIVVAK